MRQGVKDMETKELMVNGNKYLFVNESRSTSNGFCHISTLFRNGYEIASHRCNYLNRTWEVYRYQTSMKCCVGDLLENVINKDLENFKTVNMYKKMTEARTKEFKDTLKYNKLFNEYTELKDLL